MVVRILAWTGAITGSLVALLIAFVLIAGWCGLLGGSVGGTLPSGRNVTAASDGFAIGMEYSQDTATIRTCGYTVVVAPARVTVDGQQLATLDPAMKNVDLSIKGGDVTVVADGKTVGTTRR